LSPERFRFLHVPVGALGSQDLPGHRFKESTNIATFADLGTSKPVVDALQARSIATPFPVQQMVVRDALAGLDLRADR
jgi:superfamily II DNA/RNA helicase